jgi:translation initiation factor IF-2
VWCGRPRGFFLNPGGGGGGGGNFGTPPPYWKLEIGHHPHRPRAAQRVRGRGGAGRVGRLLHVAFHPRHHERGGLAVPGRGSQGGRPVAGHGPRGATGLLGTAEARHRRDEAPHGQGLRGAHKSQGGRVGAGVHPPPAPARLTDARPAPARRGRHGGPGPARPRARAAGELRGGLRWAARGRGGGRVRRAAGQAGRAGAGPGPGPPALGRRAPPSPDKPRPAARGQPGGGAAGAARPAQAGRAGGGGGGQWPSRRRQ